MNLCNIMILQFCGLPIPVIWGLIISQVHSLYPSCCGSFFMSLVVGDLWNEPGKVHPGRCQFWFFQSMVVLHADSCNFDVFMRGSALRVFLLFHLHHRLHHPPPPTSTFLKKFDKRLFKVVTSCYFINIIMLLYFLYVHLYFVRFL